MINRLQCRLGRTNNENCNCHVHHHSDSGHCGSSPNHLGIEYHFAWFGHSHDCMDVHGHGLAAHHDLLQAHKQMTILMTQHNKQKAVTNQINQIRNAVKALQKMTQSGLYVDAHQKRTVQCIAAHELTPLSW